MTKHQTRVIRSGVFWVVQSFRNNQWVTHVSLFPTRERARAVRYWFAQ